MRTKPKGKAAVRVGLFLVFAFGYFANPPSAHAKTDSQSQAKGVPKGMALIPVGEFLMGSPKEVDEPYEHPQHKVYLDAYYIDKYLVTFDQYDAYCVATNSPKPKDHGWGRGKMPVINVTWLEAEAYAAWVGKRLPTEAEWEKAAAGWPPIPYDPYFYLPGPTKLGDYAWYEANSGGHPHPVGQKPPNRYGLYDMIGNVWEMCSDWYVSDFYSMSPYKNPQLLNLQGQNQGDIKATRVGDYYACRVLRGGTYYSDPHQCRAEERAELPQDAPSIDAGFRCVKPL